MNTPVIDQQPSDLAWSDAFLLGFDPMDHIHQEFVDLLNRLLQASEAEMPTVLDALAGHTREHFAMENGWMEETQFPPRQCHMDEHAAVLNSIEQVRERVADRDYGTVPSLATALANWFPRHADHLDSALAHWISKRRFGGKPVVIRRNIELR